MRHLDAPYAQDHARSVVRKANPPKNLLGWFLDGMHDELPEELHIRGVWRDGRKRGDAPSYQPVGGSAIGSPRLSDPFRAFLEDDPFAVEVAEYEGHKDPYTHYRTPMRAALARLAGRGKDTEPYPFMARTLYRIVTMGAVDDACASMGIVEPVQQVYIGEALHRLWRLYEEEPRARPIREEAA